MSLSDLAIRNRVFAVMLSAAMIVFGYLAYRELGISSSAASPSSGPATSSR